MKNQFTVETIKKVWNEKVLFDWKNINKTLIDFWAWNGSDLVNNAMRWKLAEYIIALALWLDNWYRIEWDEYDLIYKKLKIEIKSWAYIQSWEQEKLSNIVLWIKPTDNWNWIFQRQSDIYIFAILKCIDSKIINPLNLEQWDFYIIKTEILNNKLWWQKTIWLNSLLKLNPIKSDFINLKKVIDNL
jgi:hypothetical protein